MHNSEKLHAFEGLYALVLEQTGCVSWAALHTLEEVQYNDT